MGDAKRKRASQQNRAKELEEQFDRLGIDFSRPGFFDTPQFLARERADRRFLETYAEWVLSRPRSAGEDAKVREVVPRLADIVNARLRRHDWIGGCVAVTGMVSRMLDRMGIWNVTFKGSATIANVETDETRHFAIVDELQGAGYQTGHMWLAVPPFDVVDMTLRYQRWGQDPFQEAILPVLLSEKTEIVQARIEDLVAPDIRRMYRDPDLHNRSLPDQKRFGHTFPARRFSAGDCEFRLVPSGISMTDVPLEEINVHGRQGPPAIEIWRDDVVPAFGLDLDAMQGRNS
jgi:hypothetical protein